MTSDDLEARKELTFAQAEGAAPLPSQLDRKAMPRVLRARLWSAVYKRLHGSIARDTRRLLRPWSTIISDIYVEKYGIFPNKLPSFGNEYISWVEKIFEKPDYVLIYGFIQHVLRHNKCPEDLPGEINRILVEERASYRVIENKTLMPVGSEEEAEAIVIALSATRGSRLEGANTHLKNSASAMSEGLYADSVRESIHAVEAVARTLEPSAELSTALAKIEKSSSLHGAMKKAFLALYGYSSDENGIRHPLLDKGDANVDESDALFMIGACASFVTYLIEKKRLAGLSS